MRFAIVKQVRENALDALQVGDPTTGFLEPGRGDAPDAAPFSMVR